MEAIGWILVISCFLLAYVGLIVPFLPDFPLLLVGFILYQLFLGPSGLGWTFWVAAVIVLFLSVMIDWVASGWAVRYRGGSSYSVWAAVAGLLLLSPLFIPLLGPLAFILCPCLAVILSECLISKRTFWEGSKVAFGVIAGAVASMLTKGIIMTGFLIWFLVVIVRK